MNVRICLSLAALCMFVGVAAGAFGAHGLRAYVSADLLATWHTAVLYLFVHGLALLFIGQRLREHADAHLRRAAVAMLLGILVFTGSLFILVLTGWRWLGAITPIGGVAFLLGWLFLTWSIWRTES